MSAEAVFDKDAGVFDYEEAGGAGFGSGILVFDSLLHPDYFCSDCDGAVDDGWDVFGAAKNIDNFDALRFWHVFEAWISLFAEDFGFVGIYGDDAVAGGLYILSDTETGATVIGREAHYRDGFIIFEKVANCVRTVRPVIRDRCFHSDVV